MEAIDELKLRERLWTTHPCFGKYCDDGELQCGRFLPPIDFLRDDLLDIAEKIAKHAVEQMTEYQQIGEKQGRKEVVEWLKSREVIPDVLGAVRFYASRKEWQAKLKEWGL